MFEANLIIKQVGAGARIVIYIIQGNYGYILVSQQISLILLHLFFMELSMTDPIGWMSERYPYDPDKILACARGGIYTAIMLANGNIGVCATLGHPVDTDPISVFKTDLTRIDHRILVNAFYNANCNNIAEIKSSGDIFDIIDFSGTSNNVMVGYFPPLVEKFREAGIQVKIFDQSKDYPGLVPMNELIRRIPEADRIIITSTTLFNGSFEGIMHQKRTSADLFLLGPSTPLDPEFKKAFDITGLFGMIFEPYDFEVLEIIGKGHGTPSFSAKGKKVSL